MDVSPEHARQSLDAVEDIQGRIRKAIGAGPADVILIIWGLIWLVAFTVTNFSRTWGPWVFLVLDVFGITATIAICRVHRTRGPVKSEAARALSRRVFWFWLLLFGYIGIWLLLMAPFGFLQSWAFVTTAIMFAYVVIGLWFAAPFMLWLGLAVTGLTLVGFYLLPGYFFLWMAPMGGGALVGTGLYIRRRWR